MWQKCVCCDKFCHDKHTFVVTNAVDVCLSWQSFCCEQKWGMWQLPAMIPILHPFPPLIWVLWTCAVITPLPPSPPSPPPPDAPTPRRSCECCEHVQSCNLLGTLPSWFHTPLWACTGCVPVLCLILSFPNWSCGCCSIQSWSQPLLLPSSPSPTSLAHASV